MERVIPNPKAKILQLGAVEISVEITGIYIRKSVPAGYCTCGHTIEAHLSGHSMEPSGWKCQYCSKCQGFSEIPGGEWLPVTYDELWKLAKKKRK